MASLLGLIGEFADDVGRDLYRPDQKFIRDALLGLMKSQSCRLSEWARALDENDRNGEPRALNHTAKRLSTRINARRFRDADVETRHMQRLAPGLTRDDGEGVVIAADYTDIAKPWARLDTDRGQELACRCWNGSDKTKTTGYPVVQLEAVRADGQRLPLMLRPFSFKADGYRSQNQEFIDAITDASYHVGARAWWAFDRGFDSRVLFNSLDYAGPGGAPIRWVCRLKVGNRSRMLIDANGEQFPAAEMMLRALPRYVTERTTGRGRKRRVRKVEIGARRVHTTTESGRVDPTPRTLIVIWTEGVKTPLVLLASEALTGKAAVLSAVRAYKGRWKAEESNRHAKARHGWGLGLETLQVLTMRAVKRMALLVVLAQTLLAELGEVEEITRRALRMLRVDPRAPKDLSYQLSRGVAGLLGRMRRHLIAEWRDDPGGG